MDGESAGTGTFWGEIAEEDCSHDDETEDDFQLPSLCSFETAAIHLPASTHLEAKKESSKKSALWLKAPTDRYGQNFLLHSIDLQHYKRRMRYMLAAAHSHQAELMKGGSAENSSLPFPPPPPKRFCTGTGQIKLTQPSCTCFKINNDKMASGCDIHDEVIAAPYRCPVQLDSFSARQLSLRCVAAVSAFSGFENASESAVHTLTDILVDHLQKMCLLFKIHADKEAQTANGDVLRALSHTFREFGITDILVLQDYWESNVKQVTVRLEKESLDLLNEYNSLKESIGTQKKF